ncbi:MAG: cyclodeaminase/cyclohydrolase family protein [Bacillota bacterium]|nr:cyclodeaminase/cyclohydrolase family protein [Candidatus Fermentithermobacillaceae bacterium]HAF66704.1 formimidoyltetrahydrofolate cyclodeaminase [Clostridiales bacterium UBA9857]HOA71651.1 cyclodeaminase/cyclohydrolase family protein [Bacillota bacterium]HOP70502.1 cyclodeaminase/cyclohydrolase family protein [Bacillota bacterium]HPT35765.1 cyclodeaminase/cyclohydrolase family protein [Bacillota bacterium]
MGSLFDKSLSEILRESASSAPTPGGGSVSGIAAAFAAAMAAMVGNLTIGKKKYKDVEAEVTVLRDKALDLMSTFEALVEEDISQFAKFMEAYRLPKNTQEEKQKREQVLQQALKGATETPLKVARACVELLDLVCKLAPIGNTMAISDAGVAAYLAEAGLRAVLLNVDINVPMIKDQDFVAQARKEKEGLIEQASKLREKAVSIVSERMA